MKVINAIKLHFHFKNQNRPLKGTEVKRDVCRARGSSVSNRAKFQVAPVESVPLIIGD